MIEQGTTVETYRDFELFEATDTHFGTSGIGYWNRSGAFEGPFTSAKWAKRYIDRAENPIVAKPAVQIPTTRADCGHEVESVLVMSARSETACPDCYDRMSN